MIEFAAFLAISSLSELSRVSSLSTALCIIPRNLSIDSASAAGKYASDIMAFPTTILVDRNGNIVGEPMLGGIDNQENYDTLMKQIQSVIDADSAK